MAEDKKKLEIIESINDFPEEPESNFDAAQNQFNEEIDLINKKAKRKIIIILIIIILLVVLMTITATLFAYNRNKNETQNESQKKEFTLPIPENTDHVFVNDVRGIIEEDIISTDYSGLAGRSENFRIKDISIGSGTLILAAETENLPIEIYDTHTDSLMSKDGKEMKLLISWKSNKLSRANVKYSNGVGGSEKTIKENGYGFSHALVMNKLELSTRYTFIIEANDREGNVSVSDTLVAFTGSKPVSVFDLISGEFDSIFGWAIK